MTLPERVGDQLRIGVSIPIPEPYHSRLTRARVEAGDPRAYSIPPHVTLLPPVVVEPGQMGVVVDHLSDVAARSRPFVMELSGTETFRPLSQVVFVNLRSGARECAALHEAVNAGPLRQDLQFPYHPHVTIAHDVAEENLDRAEADMAGFDALFAVAHFSLYEFGDDGVWRDVSTFVLSS